MAMSFEWDDEKRDVNFSKHKVDFLFAKGIFDSFCLTKIDERQDYGEKRFVAIWTSAEIVLVVVYVERGESIRIISARKAGRNERRYYREALVKRDRGHD